MYSCDFSFNVLPELHIRVADFKYLDEKYFNLGSVNLCKKYFENKNFI